MKTVRIDNSYSNERMEMAVGFSFVIIITLDGVVVLFCSVLFTFFFFVRSLDLGVAYILPINL